MNNEINPEILEEAQELEDALEQVGASLSEEIAQQQDKCESIVLNLYKAKLAIMEDERAALWLSAAIHRYKVYRRFVAKLPWYKKISKRQTQKIKDEIKAFVDKEFKDTLDKLEEEIREFTYENYCNNLDVDFK